MQSPSSLIFLVLLGLWAAYFVQYWIRRRDHLATARSVEQFSTAMRVLERRAPIPRTDLSDPMSRPWSVHPARAARPQATVTRPVPAERVPAAGPTHPSSRPTHPSSRPARPAVAGVRPSRRVRGLGLLAALVGACATGVLAAVALAPLWAPVVGIGLVVATLAWVRAGVRAEQAARATRRRRAEQAARRRAAASPVPSGRVVVAGGRLTPRAERPAESAVVSEDSLVAGTLASSGPAPSAGPAVASSIEVAQAAAADLTPAEAGSEPAVEYVHLVDEDDIPLTWEPVPVPRPTYTMKAKAQRPGVPPAAVTPDPVPLEAPRRAREDDLDERRVAGA